MPGHVLGIQAPVSLNGLVWVPGLQTVLKKEMTSFKKTELAMKGEVRGESGEPVSGREGLSRVLSLSGLKPRGL